MNADRMMAFIAFPSACRAILSAVDYRIEALSIPLSDEAIVQPPPKAR